MIRSSELEARSISRDRALQQNCTLSVDRLTHDCQASNPIADYAGVNKLDSHKKESDNERIEISPTNFRDPVGRAVARRLWWGVG